MNDNTTGRFMELVEFIQTKWDHQVELQQTINGLRYVMYEQCIILLKQGNVKEVINLLNQLKGSIYDDYAEDA